MLSDGKMRTVHYSIIEDGGFAGFGQGVEWCVTGLDRNWAYNPGLQGRPALISGLNSCIDCNGARLVAAYLNFVLEMFRLPARLAARSSMRGVSCFDSVVDFAASDFAGLLASAVLRRDRRPRRTAGRTRPGEFDFYVLSLSWSPSFCEAAAERGNGGRSQSPVRRPAVFLRGARPVAAI